MERSIKMYCILIAFRDLKVFIVPVPVQTERNVPSLVSYYVKSTVNVTRKTCMVRISLRIAFEKPVNLVEYAYWNCNWPSASNSIRCRVRETARVTYSVPIESRRQVKTNVFYNATYYRMYCRFENTETHLVFPCLTGEVL